MGQIIMFGVIGGIIAALSAVMYGVSPMNVAYVYTITSSVVSGITAVVKFNE